MRALDLDFHRRPPASPWSWVLLVAGLATLGWLMLAHYQIADQTHRLEAALAAIDARQPAKPVSPASPTTAGKAAAGSATPADSLAQAQQAIAKSRHPWGELFATLEKADNKDVALLAFTPDPAKGQIKIQAEARNLSAMLAYQRRLEGTTLRQVALLEHDIAPDATGTPVRFHIVANWGNNHARP